MIEFGLALIALAALFFGLGRYLSLRIADFDRGEALRKEFFNAIEPVLSDSATPDNVVKFLLHTAGALPSKTFLRRLALEILLGRRLAPSPAARHIVAEIDGLQEDQKQAVYAACGMFISALTFNNRFLGAAVRRLAMWAVDRERGSRSVTEAAAAHYDPNNDGPMAQAA